jgi:hypothetical protein
MWCENCYGPYLYVAYVGSSAKLEQDYIFLLPQCYPITIISCCPFMIVIIPLECRSECFVVQDFWIFQTVECVFIMVLGSVEDEHAFSTSIFMKSKLKNWLTIHFNVVVRMYARDFFTFKNFPSYIAIIERNEEKSHYELGL